MAIVAVNKKPTQSAFGAFAEQMQPGKTRDDVRDRAAYVYVTGQFPTHLRRNYMSILRAVTGSFQRPVSLDGRSGTIRITSDVVNELDLENHPMVKEVRAKVDEGFLIQPVRQANARRPFSRVFMYRRVRNGRRTDTEQITVTAEGAVKRGWE